MRKILILSLFSIVAFACEKSSDEKVSPEMVVEAPDNVMEIKAILSGNSSRSWISRKFELEVYGSLDCRADDIFTFFNDGTYEYDGGNLLCGDSDNQQIVQGTWEVDLENNQLIFDKNQDTQAIAKYVKVREDLLRVMGSWNSLSIDAQFVQE